MNIKRFSIFKTIGEIIKFSFNNISFVEDENIVINDRVLRILHSLKDTNMVSNNEFRVIVYIYSRHLFLQGNTSFSINKKFLQLLSTDNIDVVKSNLENICVDGSNIFLPFIDLNSLVKINLPLSFYTKNSNICTTISFADLTKMDMNTFLDKIY